MDPVADMLTRLATASRAGQPTASFDSSNFKLAIAEALKRAGYLKAITKKGKKLKKTIEVELVYQDRTASRSNQKPKIKGLQRMSKLSRRLYKPAGEVRSVRQGFGAGFYSTSSGVMTDKEAREAKVGGEYLFKIW